MSLTSRLLLPIALILALALAIVGWNAYEDASATVSRALINVEATVAQSVSREVEHTLQSAGNYLRLTASTQTVQALADWLAAGGGHGFFPERERIQRYLRRSTNIYHYINSLLFLDKNGFVVAASPDTALGGSRGGMAYFQAALVGRSFIQGPLKDPVSGEITVFMAEPVFVDGRVEGVLVGTLNMEALSTHFLQMRTMNGKGYVCVLNAAGEAILPPPDWAAQGRSLPPQTIRAMADGGAGALEYQSGGQNFYTTYDTLKYGWIVVAAMSRERMFADVANLRTHMYAVGGAAVAVTLLLVSILLGPVIAALREGVRFAEGVAEGRFDHAVAVRRNDEIGALASALNTMARRLRESFSLARERADEAEKARQKASATSRELKAVIDGIDGGVARFALDGGLRILWANPGFYALSGRSSEEAEDEDGSSALHLVLPEDREELLQTLCDALSKDGPLTAEFRVRFTTGKTTWIYLRASRVGEWNGYPVFQGVFVDISQQKQLLRTLEHEQQRYEIVTEMTEDIIFEIDLATDVATFSPHYERIFGQPRVIPDFFAGGGRMELIHPEDRALVKEACRPEGNRYASFAARIRGRDGDYQWFDVRFTTLRDESGQAAALIGRLSNIHSKKLEEDRLRREARTDLLSGLDNKMTFERHAAAECAQGVHALLIMDIDDFKKVNDSYGHSFGDEAIRAVAATLRATFRADDLLGRIGGDEFAVLVRNADEPVIRARCAGLLQRLAALDLREGYRLSVSIGVAFAPRHGRDYPTLFAHADAALYRVKKRGGKGGFGICGDAARP